ncbi:MAG: glucose-6-phosphate dehydrogenase, partial [Chloroflexota bacterium]|nr:glucose-6-phosphate dehydrogenase [Chloroflexota bacterium]
MSAALVIFGATGDLARRKLLPALFTLHCKRLLPDDLRIVGFARGKLTHAGYCAGLWGSMSGYADLTCRGDAWPSFAERVTFVQGDLARAEDVARLERTLADAERGQREADRLYYLSIAPQLYAPAIRSLRDNGMHEERGGWRRVVVEKPFGRDGASAAELDATLHEAFDEERVYRIDHYLGKETVQNVLVL